MKTFRQYLTEAPDLIAKLRAAPSLVERRGSSGYTDFILPDGTQLMMVSSQTTHAQAVAVALGVDRTDPDARNAALSRVLAAGVVRVTGRGIEVGARMTEAQAETVALVFGRMMNLTVHVDVQDAARRQVVATKAFDNPIKTSLLRAWVNAHVSA